MKVQKLLIGAVLLTILFPLFVMLLWIFVERWAWPDLWPQVFSLRALQEILGRKEELLNLLLSSVWISTVVGVLSVIIGTMTSRALVCYEFPGKKCMHFFSILPFMVPATVFAMGIQVTFIKMGLNNTVTGVIIVHLVCSLPYAIRLIIDGMEALGTGYEEQARVLGASSWQAFLKVTFPVLTPVLISAMNMAYIVSFSQYFLTLLIGGGGVKTFTIVMVPYLQSGDRNIACIYSTLFLAVTLLVFALFEKLAGKWNNNEGESFYT